MYRMHPLFLDVHLAIQCLWRWLFLCHRPLLQLPKTSGAGWALFGACWLRPADNRALTHGCVMQFTARVHYSRGYTF